LSIREFCFKEGICPATFYIRLKIYKNTLKVGSLVPVSVQGSQGETNISNSVNSSKEICKAAFLEIKYSNGMGYVLAGGLELSVKRNYCADKYLRPCFV